LTSNVDTNRSGGSSSHREQYQALRDSVGLLNLPDRGIIRVTGEQVIRMINGLVTNDLAALERGAAVFAFLLTPKGRTLATLRLFPDGPSVFLDVPAACLETVALHLGKYLPPIYARFEPVANLSVISLVGPLSDAALQTALGAMGWSIPQALASLPPLGVTAVDGHGDEPHRVFVVRREEAEGPGFDLYVPDSELESFLACLERSAREQEGAVVDGATHEIWRVERGLPQYGRDISPDNLPQETGLEERAISYEKGCYTGQEVVARIHYRGHVNRRLQGLRFDGAEPPNPGFELFLEGRTVGSVTSSVLSPRFGSIGLGYVRREIGPGSLLAASPDDDPSIETSDLPFTDP